MKKFLTGVLILALTIGAAQAQKNNQGKQKDFKNEKQWDKSQLNLTDDQKEQIQKINQDFRQKMQDLNKQDQLSVAEMKKRRQALQDDHKAQLKAVLTPDQVAKFDKLKSDKSEFRKENKEEKFNNKNGRGANKGAEWAKELNLTSDQQAKMSQIRTDYGTKLQNLRNDSSLTQDQKKQKMKDLMKQQQEDMKSVLTTEQLQKMKSLRKEQKGAK